MSEVTQILCAIDQGDPAAAEQLLPLVYEELRRLAAQKLSQVDFLIMNTITPDHADPGWAFAVVVLRISSICHEAL